MWFVGALQEGILASIHFSRGLKLNTFDLRRRCECSGTISESTSDVSRPSRRIEDGSNGASKSKVLGLICLVSGEAAIPTGN